MSNFENPAADAEIKHMEAASEKGGNSIKSASDCLRSEWAGDRAATGAQSGTGDSTRGAYASGNQDSAAEYLPGLSIEDSTSESVGAAGAAGEQALQASQMPEQSVQNNTDPFAGNGRGDIQASGIQQSSNTGDCFFESALASVADSQKGKDLIFNMIAQNTDGSYTVTFPGDRIHPVNVTQSDLADNLKRGNIANSALWAQVIETAFLKYDGAQQYGRGLNQLQEYGVPVLGPIAHTAPSLHLLTGEAVATDSLGAWNNDNREITVGSASQADVARSLLDALSKGNPVTASTSDSLFAYTGQHSSGPMADGHVYSVLSYDPKSGTVVVRNPWGNNDGTPLQNVGSTVEGITSLGGGRLSMSLNTFMSRFNDVNFAGERRLGNDLTNFNQDQFDQSVHEGNAGSALLQGNWGAFWINSMAAAQDFGSEASDELYGITDSVWTVGKTGVSFLANPTDFIANVLENHA